MAFLLMAVATLVLGGACAVWFLNLLPHIIWCVLRRFLHNPRTLWRVSSKQWLQEEAAGLPFQHGCPNCAWWDANLQSDLASRLRSGMDHVYYTGDGLRMGVPVPDRWVSCSSSAAVALWRHSPGLVLHRVEPHADDILDLRYVATDTPWSWALGRSCHLPHDAADYCVNWGRWLQEVLLDRCSRQTVVHSVLLQEGSVPEWAVELAIRVCTEAYRREMPSNEADWTDVWAAVQEVRLARVLRAL